MWTIFQETKDWVIYISITVYYFCPQLEGRNCFLFFQTKVEVVQGRRQINLLVVLIPINYSIPILGTP